MGPPRGVGEVDCRPCVLRAECEGLAFVGNTEWDGSALLFKGDFLFLVLKTAAQGQMGGSPFETLIFEFSYFPQSHLPTTFQGQVFCWG